MGIRIVVVVIVIVIVGVVRVVLRSADISCDDARDNGGGAGEEVGYAVACLAILVLHLLCRADLGFGLHVGCSVYLRY